MTPHLEWIFRRRRNVPVHLNPDFEPRIRTPWSDKLLSSQSAHHEPRYSTSEREEKCWNGAAIILATVPRHQLETSIYGFRFRLAGHPNTELE